MAEKVTQNTRNLAVLESMMAMVRALLNNDNLFVEPYVSALLVVLIFLSFSSSTWRKLALNLPAALDTYLCLSCS